MTPAEVFLHVFEDIPFPYLTADLGLLSDALKKSERDTWIRFPLPTDASKRSVAVASLRGLLRKLDVPPAIVEGMAKTRSIAHSGTADALRELQQTPGRFSLYEKGDHFIWEEDAPWPLAYSMFFQQLVGIMNVINFATEKRHASIPTSSIETMMMSEFPRQMPTQIHYAAASLGAWLSGPTNFQYFSYYATRPQLTNPDTNLRYAKVIGYDDTAAQALDRSGIVALPASLVVPLLNAQGTLLAPILGSIPIDEMNIANFPKDADKPKGAEVGLPGFILDRNYRTPFTARRLEDDGLLGANSVLRDHYHEFYAGVHRSGLVRCKHYCAPVIDVSSIDELQQHVSRIPLHDENGVFFRGQTSFYELERDAGVKRLLFADSCSVEPSLITSASRSVFNYDSLHFGLRHFVQEHVFSADSASRRDEWRKHAASPLCELDYALMALAQHYGFPSHGLDVTLSLDVATWFATNKFRKDSMGQCTYGAIATDEWPADSGRWPVIFAFQMVTHSIRQSLHDCRELDHFGYGARRPAAQQAKFFLGGHSDHQNRLAECVVCMFRLRPGTYQTTATFDRLFPRPEDDSAYRLMLDFAADPYFKFFAPYVNRFH